MSNNEDGPFDGSYAANPRTSVPNPGKPIAESTGHIASDSLAAESLRDSAGGFGTDALHKGRVIASDVPARSTTANVTDTSAATALGAAPDARQRLGDDVGETYRTPADEQRMMQPDSQRTGIYDTSRGGPQESYGGAAPRAAYASDQIDGNAAPKGRNISEGGFDASDSVPNASFNTDIGSRNDPGRLAEQRFQRANARSGADAGYDDANAAGARPGGGDQGGFENLGGDASA